MYFFGIRCRVGRRVLDPIDFIVDGTDHGNAITLLLQQMLEEKSGRRLPVCAGYADDAFPARRMIIKFIRQLS